MYLTRLKVKNWKNFKSFDIPLRDRMFIIGPNACGKSNFLDIFRFLRDIAQNGLQKAVEERGGVSKIRSLFARGKFDIEIEVELSNNLGEKPVWYYKLQIKQRTSGGINLYGHRLPYVESELVEQSGKIIDQRPDESDLKDKERLTQTHLEQISANQEFRDIKNFFDDIVYLHLVPQLVRNPQAFTGPGLPGDPYGRTFLEKVARTPRKQRDSKLAKIQKALQVAVPQLKQLNFEQDETGIPHLAALLEHWRPEAGKQREDQFSDGTLRLIGLLWSLLESDSLLLLEEPELSLHSGIVQELPALMYQIDKAKKKQRRQVFLSTHSPNLLSDQSISGDEVILMIPTAEGTQVKISSAIEDIRLMLESGLTIADAVLPRTVPMNIEQLSLFE